MKKAFLYIGLALVVIGAAVGAFTGISGAKWAALAGCAVGFAACAVSIFAESEKKDWKLWVSLAGIAAGTVLLVFAGLSEAVITSIISGVIGLALLIAGLLPALVKKKGD